MAKWGEGDPRWIVEERPDATNVNNWHWTEKNATNWSKDRIYQLLNELKIEQNGVNCSIEGVDKCTGEATVNNRKGKLIFFYEWELILKWSGTLPQNNKASHKGKITIPNLSEENDIDEVEITVTIDESNDESEILKEFMYNIGRDKIREKLKLYIKELKEEYSKNLILPRKGDTTIVSNNIQVTNKAPNSTKSSSETSASNGRECTVGYKLDVKALTMTEEFQCTANDLYNALTNVQMLTAFSHAPAKSEPIRGGDFQLYGGNVQGKFEELIPEKKIVQSWRLKNWPSGHFSTVTICIEEMKNCTQLTLKQSGIPSAEYDAMRTNWHRYYWHSIKQTFGFGVILSNSL